MKSLSVDQLVFPTILIPEGLVCRKLVPVNAAALLLDRR